MQFLYVLASTLAVSLFSLVGVITLAVNEKLLRRVLFGLVAFSAGALIGGAFLHLIPEAIEHTDSFGVFIYVVAGFVLFFILEKFLYWRHCHDGVCDVHTFTYLNLIGDGVHNFIDGMVIAAAYTTSINFGLITTLVVVMHEIPQELGDFGVLVYGGFTKKKALALNFFVALAAILGAVIGYFLSESVADISYPLVALTAGGFIYIASSDLVPEIQKETTLKKSSLSLLFFVLGIILMSCLKAFSH